MDDYVALYNEMRLTLTFRQRKIFPCMYSVVSACYFFKRLGSKYQNVIKIVFKTKDVNINKIFTSFNIWKLRSSN